MRISKAFSAVVAVLAVFGGAALTDACNLPPGQLSTEEPPPSGSSSGGVDFGASSTSSGGFAGSSTGSSGGFPIAPQPTFMANTHAARPPPAISGGTLLVTRSGAVVASDPDRDAIYVVDTASMALKFTIALQAGDEPGRLAEDGSGRVHVALRGGGVLVTVNPTTGTVVERRPVCPAPRGLAWDASSDLVWVACATGELVAFPSAGGAAAHSFVIERDLRDVVVQSGSLAVSKFRSAEMLRVARDGTVLRRDVLSAPRSTSPQVAWRTVGGPLEGSTITVHQTESTDAVETNVPGGYGGGFGGSTSSSGGGIDLEAGVPVPSDDGSTSSSSSGAPIEPPLPSGPIVTSAVTILDAKGAVLGAASLGQGVLPVDVALSRDGSFLAIAFAGNGFALLPSVQLVPLDASSADGVPNIGLNGEQAVAVAFDTTGNFLVQTREPARILVVSATKALQSLTLSMKSSDDTGHDIFHTQAGGLMACASCHPEGGDDGHTWLLNGLPRRTPSLRGTIAGTAPYHWPGDEKDMGILLDDVYTGRMSGAKLDDSQKGLLTSWVEAIPAPAAPSWVDRVAALRGQALFESAATGCKTCHAGAKFTNNATVDVGTGHDVVAMSGEDRPTPGPGNNNAGPPPVAFQVPPLVGVGWHAPLLHDGCALTIVDRFGKCATPSHGSTSQLTQQNIADLAAYLETL